MKSAVMVSPCGFCPCATTRSPLPHRSIFDGLNEFFDSRPCSGREPPVGQQWWSGGACRGVRLILPMIEVEWRFDARRP
jgi:hypothetical protein